MGIIHSVIGSASNTGNARVTIGAMTGSFAGVTVAFPQTDLAMTAPGTSTAYSPHH